MYGNGTLGKLIGTTGTGTLDAYWSVSISESQLFFKRVHFPLFYYYIIYN